MSAPPSLSYLKLYQNAMHKIQSAVEAVDKLADSLNGKQTIYKADNAKKILARAKETLNDEDYAKIKNALE